MESRGRGWEIRRVQEKRKKSERGKAKKWQV